MTDAPEPQQVALRIKLPETQHAGVLADAASIWRTDGYFVLDFIAQEQPIHPEFINGQEQLVSDNSVVARIKVLPTQILPLIEALKQQSDAWIAQQSGTADDENLLD